MGRKVSYLLDGIVFLEKLLILLTYFLHLLKFFILFPDSIIISGVILGATYELPNNSDENTAFKWLVHDWFLHSRQTHRKMPHSLFLGTLNILHFSIPQYP